MVEKIVVQILFLMTKQNFKKETGRKWQILKEKLEKSKEQQARKKRVIEKSKGRGLDWFRINGEELQKSILKNTNFNK